MEASILNDFFNYIEFLRSKGYFVSISGFEDNFEPYTSRLLNYNVHLHSVCIFLKQSQASAGMCILNKKRLNSSKITEPYYSCCYAGVEEYVIPVMYEGKCIMRINVSGFRGGLKKSEKFMARMASKTGEKLARLYLELSTNVPTLATVTGFANPLGHIACRLYELCKRVRETERCCTVTKQIFIRAEQYIQENYMNKITCESVAEFLNYSSSYLQYIFKKEGNTTVKAYINNVRLNNAQHLLLHTDMSITDVAYSCGFSDSNYFSTAFKQKNSISPKKYRFNRVDKSIIL